MSSVLSDFSAYVFPTLPWKGLDYNLCLNLRARAGIPPMPLSRYPFEMCTKWPLSSYRINLDLLGTISDRVKNCFRLANILLSSVVN